MLSPTDIHYIVALLTAQYEADQNIELELGSTLFDEAAEQNRDIDVTITYKNSDGSIYALKGLEVKNHKRPLTTEQVEQLCAKFQHIPSITQKGIISASGYTKSAIKKARYYNIDLFYLELWAEPNKTEFFRIKFDKEMLTKESIYYWHKTFPEHQIFFRSDSPYGPQTTFNEDQPVFTEQGQLYKLQTLEALYREIDQRTLKEFLQDKKVSSAMRHLETKKANVVVNIKDSIYLVLEDKKWFIDQVRIAGPIIRVDSLLQPEFKIMRKHGEKNPYIGCAIMESQMGIFGVSVNQKTGVSYSGLFHISVSDRLKQKIYREKFRRDQK